MSLTSSDDVISGSYFLLNSGPAVLRKDPARPDHWETSATYANTEWRSGSDLAPSSSRPDSDEISRQAWICDN